MKLLPVLIATLGLLTTLASGQNQTVESNVTLAFRVLVNLDEGTETTRKTTTLAFKNADCIRLVGQLYGVEYSKKARLLQQVTFDATGIEVNRRFIVRDPSLSELDLDVPLTLQRSALGDVGFVETHKLKTEAGTGSRTVLSHSWLYNSMYLEDNDEENNLLIDFEFYGAETLKGKILSVGSSNVELESSSLKLAGSFSFMALIKGEEVPVYGVAGGKMSISGSKVTEPAQ